MEQGKQVNPQLFQEELVANVQSLTYENIMQAAYIRQLEQKIEELTKVEEKEETV